MKLEYTVEQAEMVLGKLDQDDPNILRAACYLAGAMGLQQAERGLIRALGSKVWQVRMEAAAALGRIGSKGALPYLRRLIKAAESETRQKMLNAAAGKAAQEGDEEDDPRVAQAAAIAINHIDPSIAQEALLAALQSDQPQLIIAAMAGLANLRASEGRKEIIGMMNSSDPGVRRTAAAALGKLKETSAAEGLIGLLEDSENEVRKEAIIALNHIKSKQALQPLANCMKDKSPEVRRVAAIALGNSKSRSEQVVGALVAGLADRDAPVRQACLSALTNCKASQALVNTISLLGDTHEEVSRQAAATAIALAQDSETPDYDTGW